MTAEKVDMEKLFNKHLIVYKKTHVSISEGVTIDEDLELKNFPFTGRTLAEIWSDLVIDGNPVVAEFNEEEAPVIVETKSEEWNACHVRQSQYFLQNVKCTDKKSCSSFKSY